MGMDETPLSHGTGTPGAPFRATVCFRGPSLAWCAQMHPVQAAVKDASPTDTTPGEKSVVERMRALRKEGLGFDWLAVRLNEEGFRTRKGTAWHGFGVNRILSRLATK